MPRLRIAAYGLLAALVATPAAAQSVTADLLATFVRERGSSYKYNPPPDWEGILYEAALARTAPDAVIAEFATRVGVSRDAARTYAWVIIESVVEDETCEESDVRPERCAFAPGQPRYERAAAAGLADATGHLLMVVGRTDWFRRKDEATFVTLAGKHRAASSIFAAMFDHDDDPAYLLAALKAGRASDALAIMAAREYRYVGWSRGDQAWQLAMIEALEQSARSSSASPERQAALAQLSLSWRLDLGLPNEALEGYYAYPRAIRNLLPVPLEVCQRVVTECSEIAKGSQALGDELAAALWIEGHHADARRVLQVAQAGLGARPVDARKRYAALADAIAPVHRKEDLFSLFIHGRLSGERPSSLAFSSGEDGWLFVVRSSGRAVRQVVASRLREAGHTEMADHLDRPARRRAAGDGDPVLGAVAAMFPAMVHRRQAFWDARLAALATPIQRVSNGPVRVSTPELPAWWTERPLPASMRHWQDGDPAQPPPEGVTLPVDRKAVIRYEERNGERAMVYLSSEYDLPGEIPAFGMWFARTVGGTWTPPLYLGLQQHFPYIATDGSNLPLIDGNHLRLEVQVREIDADTITFPPVALGLKRSADGLYLDFDLATLALDRDGDGLTDIAERRLGLDAMNTDTDGDGAPDAADPLPLVRYRASPSARDGLARAIVSEIFGSQPRPIVTSVGDAPTIERVLAGNPTGQAASRPARTRFLVGDPSMFASIATPFRLMVYAPQDLQALNRESAPFYPAEVSALFSSLDGTQHFVEWSTGWSGGSFMVTCNADGACTTTQMSTWIS